MKNFASNSIPDAAGRLQFETWPRWVGLLLFFASFLVIISVGCGNGQVPEVTVFYPDDEATELRLSDPDVLFLRQKPVIAGNRVFEDGEAVGELVLDGQCLRLKDSAATIVWPAGFTPHVEGGVVHVRNGAGRTIARVGDEIAGGGGSKRGHGECSGQVFRIHDVKVLPDVEVYFPKQDGTLTAGQVVKRRVGELALDGKCLGVRIIDGYGVPEHALLLWPSEFELNVQDGAVKVIDATGRVVARVGDEVEVSAFNVTYDQAIKHGGLEKITPACSAPYWAVGGDFAATETP